MCGSPTVGHKVLGKRLNASQGINPGRKIGVTTTVVRCNSCGLIYSNPQPVPASLQDHYGVPPDEYWRPEYFNVGDTYFQSEINRLKSLMSFGKNERALDIGAGIGKCMTALSRAGFDTYGIEPSETFFNWAINRMRIDRSRLSLGSLEESFYPEEYFGFITFGAVLEHLYDPSAAIKKALVWLKKGGLIHIEVPSSRWLIGRLINMTYKLRGMDYVTNISPMHEPFHLYEFALDSFRKNAEINGYSVRFHECYVAQTYLPKILDSVLVPLMRLTKTGMQLCVWLQKT